MKELKKGDLIICFNKNTGFESLGYIRAIWGDDTWIVYTFKNAGIGVWTKSHIKYLTI